VPRSFTTPGGRLKLDRGDLFALGRNRGGICERWIASTTKADNGKDTGPDEGLSYVRFEGTDSLLSDMFEQIGEDLLGVDSWREQGAWNVLCKMFDNVDHVPLHAHHNASKAADVGQKDKPEAYFFPIQFNSIEQAFPLTYFGLQPHVTRAMIVDCLRGWNDKDNQVVDLSAGYRLRPGTGWQVNPGVLHAPGSLATYTIEKCSDVLAMFQNVLGDQFVPWDLVIKNIPGEHQTDLEYIADLVDIEANTDPGFVKKNKLVPVPIGSAKEDKDQGFSERWITFGKPDYSAKELTVLPGRSCIVSDEAAYGAFVIQGHGKFGNLAIEAASMIKFGEMTADELFVSYSAAHDGIRVANVSETEPLVILKHFGPNNPDCAHLVR
jgi:hypothetical protein